MGPEQPVIPVAEVRQAVVQLPLMEVENLAKNHITAVQQRKEELSQARAKLQDVFMTNTEYANIVRQETEQRKVKKELKDKILKQQDAADAQSNVDELSEHVKDAKEGLTHWLAEYRKVSGKSDIEDSTGKRRTIKEVLSV